MKFFACIILVLWALPAVAFAQNPVPQAGPLVPVNNRVLIENTPDTSWSPFANSALIVTQHGRTNGIVGYELNDLSPDANALPAGVVGYGKLAAGATGNQVFGIYGLAGNYASAGVAIGAEFSARNYCGAPDTSLPPNERIGTQTCVSNGLQVTSGGTYGSSVGMIIGAEAGSSHYFNTGVYLKNFTRYGLFVSGQSSGSQTSALLQNNGTGINLKLQTTGAISANNAVITVVDQKGSSHFNIRQDGDIHSTGALNVGGQVKFSGLSATPGGKQPLCIDTSTHTIYASSGGSC